MEGASPWTTSPPGLQLRAATPDDTDLLRAIYTSTRADELAQTDWSEEQKAQFCRMQFEAQDTHYRAHYPGARFLIIEEHGAAAGRLYLADWEKETRIMDLALLPAHRNRGIGTALLRHLQDSARAAGRALSIHVERFNPALRLYQRLGFSMREDKGVYLLMEWRP